MSHYGRTGVTVVAPRDFNSWWKSQTPVVRDGCSREAKIIREYADKNATERARKRIEKIVEDAGSYKCIAWDVGVDHYAIIVRKRKIVNHKIREVADTRVYKKKPSRIPKNGTLVEMHEYIISYDARCYDPLEHGEEW